MRCSAACLRYAGRRRLGYSRFLRPSFLSPYQAIPYCDSAQWRWPRAYFRSSLQAWRRAAHYLRPHWRRRPNRLEARPKSRYLPHGTRSPPAILETRPPQLPLRMPLMSQNRRLLPRRRRRRPTPSLQQSARASALYSLDAPTRRRASAAPRALPRSLSFSSRWRAAHASMSRSAHPLTSLWRRAAVSSRAVPTRPSLRAVSTRSEAWCPPFSLYCLPLASTRSLAL